MRRLYGATATLAVGAAMLAGATTAAAETVYDNTPTPQPGNVFSEAFEAQSAREFGGQIQLAGMARETPTISVLMSTWGCETGRWHTNNCSTTPGATFEHPITLNVYNVGPGDSPGTLIESQEKTFDIPYRPSKDPLNCTGANAGKWFDGTACFNGMAVNLTFDPLGVPLPDKVIVSLAYSTTHYGAPPIGEGAPCFTSSGGCGYDSLNVGLAPGPTVGSTPLPSDAYLNSTWTGAYCDHGAAGTNTFRLDSGCWTGFQPAIQVDAPDGPMVQKQEVKASLVGEQATATGSSKKEIGEAIKHLDKSLTSTYWVDDSHLTRDKGKTVFDEEKAAVDHLLKVKAPSDVSQEIAQLVAIDRRLAEIAIGEIPANADNPSRQDELEDERAKANEELAKGDVDRDINNKPKEAIDHYKHAWEHAQHAMEDANHA